MNDYASTDVVATEILLCFVYLLIISTSQTNLLHLSKKNLARDFMPYKKCQ